MTGDPFEDAESAIQSRGLEGRAPRRGQRHVARGSVIRTDPPRATRWTKRHGTVVVIVSIGPAPVTVPDVDGRRTRPTRPQTLGQRRASRCRRRPSRAAPSPPGNVIGTEPGGRARRRRGAAPVTIIVSTGPEPVDVPNVVGDTQSDATDELIERRASTSRSCRCRRRAPNAGHGHHAEPDRRHEANTGSTVTITGRRRPVGAPRRRRESEHTGRTSLLARWYARPRPPRPPLARRPATAGRSSCRR